MLNELLYTVVFCDEDGKFKPTDNLNFRRISTLYLILFRRIFCPIISHVLILPGQ